MSFAMIIVAGRVQLQNDAVFFVPLHFSNLETKEIKEKKKKRERKERKRKTKDPKLP
jgi:hypothetical protein